MNLIDTLIEKVVNGDDPRFVLSEATLSPAAQKSLNKLKTLTGKGKTPARETKYSQVKDRLIKALEKSGVKGDKLDKWIEKNLPSWDPQASSKKPTPAKSKPKVAKIKGKDKDAYLDWYVLAAQGPYGFIKNLKIGSYTDLEQESSALADKLERTRADGSKLVKGIYKKARQDIKKHNTGETVDSVLRFRTDMSQTGIFIPGSALYLK